MEVMIALAIMGVITTTIFRLYITSHKNYIVQEEVQYTQQNARAVIDELCRQIRMAGYDLPPGMDAVISANTNPDTITVRYRTNNCDTYLASSMPQTSSELDCATDVTCFHVGQWVYIFEPNSGDGEWFEISNIQHSPSRIQHNLSSFAHLYGKDAIVAVVNQVKFYVDNTTDTENSTLMIEFMGQSPHIFADNIADLQFQYRMKNGILLDSVDLAENVREVMIFVEGRSLQEDLDINDFGNGDSYRHRIFSTSVYLRNLGL